MVGVPSLVLMNHDAGRLIFSSVLRFIFAIWGTNQLYASGARRTEAARIKVEDIDSQRMVIHIRQGKGTRDRDVLRFWVRTKAYP